MKNTKQILNLIIICIILTVIATFLLIGYEENKLIESKEVKVPKYAVKTLGIENEIQEEVIKVKEDIIKEYKGYEVCAKLEIPKIKLETYILKEFSTKALETSVVKFWGVDPNRIGNFCVAGHNFRNKNMFHDLKKLSLGDRIFISDNDIGKIEYEVYEFYTVFPEDVSCLSQDTNGKIVTLITCTADSKKRIIVKAKELKSS